MGCSCEGAPFNQRAAAKSRCGVLSRYPYVMTPVLTVEEYYRMPGCAAAVRRVQNDLISVDTGERGGVVRYLERRFVWQYDGPTEMMKRIASEQVVWDDYSDTELK